MPAMTEPPKRRPWFQLHLSTCMVLMVESAALTGLNVVETKLPNEWSGGTYGWPSVAYSRIATENFLGFGEILGEPSFEEMMYAKQWIGSGVALNLAVALLILAASAQVSESFIRRRERKRTEHPSAN